MKRESRADRQARVLRRSRFFTGTAKLLPFQPASLDGVIAEKLAELTKIHTGESLYEFAVREYKRIEYGA